VPEVSRRDQDEPAVVDLETDAVPFERVQRANVLLGERFAQVDRQREHGTLHLDSVPTRPVGCLPQGVGRTEADTRDGSVGSMA
jgi:hypothetical protein